MNMTHFTTITHLLIWVSYTETIHSIDQLYIKQFTLQISWYWDAIFSYSTNKAICWKSSFMLISWKAALSSSKDSYFFTTNPCRLKKEIIVKRLLYIWLPHWLLSLSLSHTHLRYTWMLDQKENLYLMHDENDEVSMRTFIILSLHFFPEESTSIFTVFKRWQNSCRHRTTVTKMIEAWLGFHSYQGQMLGLCKQVTF